MHTCVTRCLHVLVLLLLDPYINSLAAQAQARQREVHRLGTTANRDSIIGQYVAFSTRASFNYDAPAPPPPITSAGTWSILQLGAWRPSLIISAPSGHISAWWDWTIPPILSNGGKCCERNSKQREACHQAGSVYHSRAAQPCFGGRTHPSLP